MRLDRKPLSHKDLRHLSLTRYGRVAAARGHEIRRRDRLRTSNSSEQNFRQNGYRTTSSRREFNARRPRGSLQVRRIDHGAGRRFTASGAAPGPLVKSSAGPRWFGRRCDRRVEFRHAVDLGHVTGEAFCRMYGRRPYTGANAATRSAGNRLRINTRNRRAPAATDSGSATAGAEMLKQNLQAASNRSTGETWVVSLWVRAIQERTTP